MIVSFPQQLNASAIYGQLAQALYLTYQGIYGDLPFPSWQSLDYQTRKAFENFGRDMLENLHLEMSDASES